MTKKRLNNLLAEADQLCALADQGIHTGGPRLLVIAAELATDARLVEAAEEVRGIGRAVVLAGLTAKVKRAREEML